MRKAIERAEQGLVDADLGGGLIKQRVAQQGQGRSGGFRVIVADRAKRRAVFLFGFAKNEQENISLDELVFLRELAKNWLAADTVKIRNEIEAGNLQEIEDDKET
ncbi:MAG: type II toxin-antitoxin system RelE/ParE family toxin [Terracidiphilus sp.]